MLLSQLLQRGHLIGPGLQHMPGTLAVVDHGPGAAPAVTNLSNPGIVGLNVLATVGVGKPGKSPSNETVITQKKLSNALKNRHFSEKTRSKISAAKKEYWRIKKSLIA
jgi:hypothetical protein